MGREKCEKETWEEAERRREEGLLTEEKGSWSLEMPDPRVFPGDEKRELLFSLVFAQWVPPATILLA